MHTKWIVCLVLLPLLTEPARACTCIPNPPPQDAVAEADGVFAAAVLHMTEIDQTYPRLLRVEMRLLRRFKGAFDETVTVRTARDSPSCGFPFREGESYLVYVRSVEGHLHASLCSRTAALADAAEDLIELDAEDLLDEESGSGRGRARCSGPTNAAAMQGLVFVFLGLLLRRRSRATPPLNGEVSRRC